MPIAVALPYIAAASAVAGTVSSMDSARKQAHAQQDAAAVGQANTDKTNAMNYAHWLETQGIGSNGEPINTWLPRYAMVKRSVPGAPMDGNTPKPSTQFYAAPSTNNTVNYGSPMSDFAPAGGGDSRSWTGLGINR